MGFIYLNKFTYLNASVIQLAQMFNLDNGGQRNPEGYISHITPTAGRYQDIARTTGQGDIMILPWFVVRLIALTHKGLFIDLHSSLYKRPYGF